jgi:hypothetical protein
LHFFREAGLPQHSGDYSGEKKFRILNKQGSKTGRIKNMKTFPAFLI